MKYAVFTVMMPEFTTEESIALLAELGYNGAEFRVTVKQGDEDNPGYWSGNRCTVDESTFLETAPRLREACDKAGLEVPSLGT